MIILLLFVVVVAHARPATTIVASAPTTFQYPYTIEFNLSYTFNGAHPFNYSNARVSAVMESHFSAAMSIWFPNDTTYAFPRYPWTISLSLNTNTNDPLGMRFCTRGSYCDVSVPSAAVFFNISSLLGNSTLTLMFFGRSLELVYRYQVDTDVTWSSNGIPQQIVMKSTNGNELAVQMLTVVRFSNELRPQDYLLLHTSRAIPDRIDTRCSSFKTAVTMPLYRVHGGGNMSLTNRNVADPPGEVYFLKFSEHCVFLFRIVSPDLLISSVLPRGRFNTSFVSEYTGVVVDPRWRIYELCNKGSCDRSNYFSPLGVGAQIIRAGQPANMTECTTQAIGMWYSLPSLGECDDDVGSFDCSWSQRNATMSGTISVGCLWQYLAPVVGAGHFNWTSVQPAWDKAWTVCPRVTPPSKPIADESMYAHKLPK
jgi:hypothetical protein